MIKYLPVQDEEGAIESWSLINTRNETSIIFEDHDIKNLCTCVFIENNTKNLLSPFCDTTHNFKNYSNESEIKVNAEELDELSKMLLKIVRAGNYTDPFHAVQS